MRKFLASRLKHPWLPAHLALLATALTLPALGVGWQLDDHYQRVVMTSDSPLVEIGPSEIFSVFNGDPETIHRYIDLGTIPWWTVANFRLAFVRHLTILTHWLDYRLWPGSAALMHVHSLLWFAALIAAAALLYRRIMGLGAVAGLAALLYAIDDAHAFPAAWLSNRNALLATCFGVLCLVAHDRWRCGGSRRAAVLGPVFLVLALASGEAAVATLGYLVAYALFLERGRAGRKVLSLAPSGAVIIAWAIVYRVLGFGAYGSGMYIDPLSDAGYFIGILLQRAPFLFLGQWSPIPADVGTLLTGEATHPFWWTGIFCVVLIALIAVPLIRRDRAARFWCFGMMASLVPISATFPSNRLLFFVGIGGAGLVAQILAGLFGWADWLPSARVWRVPARTLGILLIIVHLILSPVAMPLSAHSVKTLGGPTDKAVASVPSDPDITGQDLILVNSPDYLLYVTRIPTLKFLKGEALPRRMRALVTGPVAVDLARVDERTLRVRVDDGLLLGALGSLFRGDRNPLAVGDTIDLTGFTAEVAAVTADRRPQEIVFRFSVPLEDPSLRWLRWEGDRYVSFVPPPEGASVSLEPALGTLESWPDPQPGSVR